MNIVYNRDCMEAMKEYPDKYFELAIVDPDFGLNEKISNGGTWAAKYERQDGFLGGKPSKEYFDDLFRVSKNQIIWGGNYFLEYLNSSRCFIVWDKIAHMNTLADAELAWTSFDRNTKIFKHVRNTAENRIHICQKPIELYGWLLNNYAKTGDKILDTHVGSGSSRIAAYKLGFDFTGYELDKDYWEAQEKRYQDFIKQSTLLF